MGDGASSLNSFENDEGLAVGLSVLQLVGFVEIDAISLAVPAAECRIDIPLHLLEVGMVVASVIECFFLAWRRALQKD